MEIRPHFQRHRPPAGARPGVIVIPPDARPTTIHVVDYTSESLDESDVDDPAELTRYLGDESVTWIEVDGLGDEAKLRAVFEVFGIHPLAQADVVNVPQRPRTDTFDGHDLVVLRMARPGQDDTCLLEQVSLLVGPSWVVSVQEGAEDVFDPVRARLHSRALIRQMKADYLAYALIDTLIDGYFPVVDQLGEVVEELEDEVVSKPSKETLTAIHDMRRELLVLHRTMRQQRDAMNLLLRGGSPRFSPDARIYLRDAFDHAIQISDVLEGFREMAIGLMEVYLSSVSNRMNEIMKVLTIISTIFIPLTFLVGVYGMNFHHMPELDSPWGYPVVWGVMIVIAIMMLLFFRRKGWLGDGGSRGDDATEE